MLLGTVGEWRSTELVERIHQIVAERRKEARKHLEDAADAYASGNIQAADEHFRRAVEKQPSLAFVDLDLGTSPKVQSWFAYALRTARVQEVKG